MQVGTNQSQTPRQKPWRRALNILHGTADSQNTLAADVDLVAYGVAKNATADGLKSFLETRGISVVQCVNLTTFEHARTHSYKVTIKASEYEKATKPEVWPFRVGVRLFKQFKKKTDEQQTNWDSQVRLAPPPASVQSQVNVDCLTPSEGIETSNMFHVLASGGPNLTPDH